jgi:hypothetical protein
MPNDAGMRRLLVASTKMDQSSRTDRDLLRQFIAGGDESAFEALIRRHTNLVLGACRRSLANGQDAEDACQTQTPLEEKKERRRADALPPGVIKRLGSNELAPRNHARSTCVTDNRETQIAMSRAVKVPIAFNHSDSEVEANRALRAAEH